MNPKKTKELIETYAKSIDQDPEFVQDLITFYWKKIRQDLTTCADFKINVHKLGYFKLNFYQIEKDLKKFNNIARVLEGAKSPMKIATKYDILNKIEILKKAMDFCQVEYKKRIEKRTQRYANYNGKKAE